MIDTDLLHYHIDAHLGSGGMGEVYRARDTKLGRAVALKFLPELVAADADRVARFEREARLLASLNHPSIASLYAVEQAEGRSFLVMELVEGETLADRIGRGPIPAGEALTLAKQICEALEAAHEKGVIHRDLKPANIKITPAGQIKVLDFGLGKTLGSPTQQTDSTHSPTRSFAATSAGVILGTAAYMSPEQAKGADVDQRADIFALGCVLFEMLTGRPPFRGGSVAEILASVIKSDPDLTTLPANLHPRLAAVLRRCLAKDLKQRWHAVADVRLEIEALLVDPHGATLAREGKAPRVPLWKRAALFAATALVAAAATGVVAWFARPVTPATITRFSDSLPADQQFSHIERHILAFSPDGQNLVYVANNQLYLRRLGEIEAHPVQGTSGSVSTPFFSPDGQWIGFWSAETLQKIATTGGTPVPIADMPIPLGASWHANDSIFIGQGGQGILRVSAQGGQRETVIEVKDGERAVGPQLLPDGDHVLFTLAGAAPSAGPFTLAAWDNAQIVVQSLESGERKVLVEGASDARYLPSGHIIFAVGESLYAMAFDAASLAPKGSRVRILEQLGRGLQAGAMFLAFSESGSMAYVARNTVRRRLAFVDGNDGFEELPFLFNETYSNPRISPDGSQFVIERGGADETEVNLWVYDVTNKALPRQLTYGTGTQSVSPEWTRDGKRIVFLHKTGDTETVMSLPADGSGLAEPFTMARIPGMNSAVISLSSDDRNVLVRAGPADQQQADIWLLPAGGTEQPRPVTRGPGNKARARFSPNGNWMVYQSNETRGTGTDIHVLDFQNGVTRRITNGGGHTPDWSPDGDHVFFLVNNLTRDMLPRARLMSVEFSPQSGLAVRRPTMVFDGVLGGPRSQQPYSVARDGRILVLTGAEEPAEARSPDIRVTLNWFEELKQRVPTN